MPDGRRRRRAWLQGAGLQPGRGGGAHGLADAVAADGRGQGDPPDRGGAVLAAGHRPADPDGLFHQGPGVRAAFGLVAGEQAGAGPAGEHVCEFPGQVVGVAQPGRQALADERRGEVGGVAEQEDAPGLEPGRQPGAEGVTSGADDLQAGQVAAPGPRAQQGAEGGWGDQAGFVLAVQQPEFPAVPVAGDVHEGGGPGGVADLLHAVPGVQAVLGLDVDHQPVLGEAQVLHGDPGQVPDGAVGAVAAQHDPAGERLRLAADAGVDPDRGRGERAGGIVVVQPGHLGAAAEVDQRVFLDPGEQQFFQVGLVEHVRLREAVFTALVLAAELGHDAVVGVEQPQPAAGPGPGQETLADGDPVQDPDDLVVQVHRARQRVGPGAALQQGDRDPEVGQQEGRGTARPGRRRRR